MAASHLHITYIYLEYNNNQNCFIIILDHDNIGVDLILTNLSLLWNEKLQKQCFSAMAAAHLHIYMLSWQITKMKITLY